MTDVFPSVLKTAKVVPVFKKDSTLDYSNSCSISLLSNIEKILERLMYKRLYTFVSNNNIIYNLQFGFRQQYSTSHAWINITKNIWKALDDRNTGYRIFVDIQKAFDTCRPSDTASKIKSAWSSWSLKWLIWIQSI